MPLARCRPALGAALWLALAAGFPPALSWAHDATASLENPVKAALLVNFARFTEWPADSAQSRAATVSICVLGIDPFGDILEATVVRRSAGGRPLRVESPDSVEATQACHVLFVANSEAERLPQLLRLLADQPVLTVGETEGFVEHGGVIGLVVVDNRARFDVNLAAAEHRGLSLSSKLVGVARTVVGRPARPR